MFNPKYRTLLTTKCFPEDGVVGLGKQLISIVHFIKKYLISHVWYGADIEAIGKEIKKPNLSDIHPNKIGSDIPKKVEESAA